MRLGLLLTRLVQSPPKLYSRTIPRRSDITSNTFPSFSTTTQTPLKPLSGIGASIVSHYSHLWSNNSTSNADAAIAETSSLQDILKVYIHLCPETTRRFWRVSALEPQHFIEILLGSGPDVDPNSIRSFFMWAPKKMQGFRHLSMSYRIVALMLLRASMLREAESLVLESGDRWLFSELIQGYVDAYRADDSIRLYDVARLRGLILSSLCYKALLRILTGTEKAELALRVYMDMIKIGRGSSSEDRFLEFVVGSLSKNGRVLEAVNVLRTVKSAGVEPSGLALSAVVEGYCRKKDYGDILNFLEEWKYIPEPRVCNKVVGSLCRDLGVEEASLIVQKMEDLGFEFDAMTFGILISHSCKERMFRNAFIYLSESFSRCIKLEVNAYNALISGIMKEGMHSCAGNIFEEMVEKGTIPEQSTFKVMLAGYCKHRKFDEVKKVVDEMMNSCMISLIPMEDALSRAFMLLGLEGVKVKRDNSAGLAKTEFFDTLGNGLYLETDVEEYDKKLEVILDNGMLPDFDSLILTECCKDDAEAALRVTNEALQWGVYPSLSSYSELLKLLCASPTQMKTLNYLLDEMPELTHRLGHETLNLLIQSLSKNGMATIARLLLGRLYGRHIPLESDSYTALVLGFCNEKNVDGLRECLLLTQVRTWLPGHKEIEVLHKEIEVLTTFLCKSRMIKEVLELFDRVMDYLDGDLISVMCNDIVKELCATGFSTVGYALVKEILQRGISVDNEAFANLLEGFLKEQKTKEALGIIDELLQKNITLTVNVYKLITPLLFRFDSAEKAKSLKHSILNAQSEPTNFVYNTMLNELCRMGKMKEAFFDLQEMLLNRCFPDGNTLNALIRGYCHANNLGKALEILCVTIRYQFDLSITGYRSLVRLFCAYGHLPGALSLKKLMQVESESDSLVLWNILLFWLFKSGNGLFVQPLLKNMLEKHISPDHYTYNILIYGYYKCGDVSRSVKLLNSMVLEDMTPNKRSVRTVISYLCGKGELNKALELNKVMECSGWKHGSVSLYALIEAIVLCGGIHKAEVYLDQLKLKGMIAENVNYDLLIPRLCEQGSIKKAVCLLNLILEKGNCPNDTSYSFVIKGLSLQKAFDQALDLHAEMAHKNLQPRLDSCNALICGLCDDGRTNDARNFLGQILWFGPIPTASMYNYVIEKLYAANNLAEASELMQEMQKAGHSPNFETHWSLISNLSTCDNKEDDIDGTGFLSRLLSGNSTPL